MLYCRLLLANLLLLASATALAHHSFAIYDIDNRIERTGVLTKFEYRSPHIMLEVQVSRDDGSTETWQVETLNPGRWERAGLPRQIASEGDAITIRGWPARNGTDLMLLSSFDAGQGTQMVIREVKQERARDNIPVTTIHRD
jgi:hypothetical protein